MIRRLREAGVRRLRTGLGWADWDRPGAEAWFDHVMAELADFDLTLTLCFTPARLGLAPHHTSPPRDLTAFADFCQAVAERYVRPPAHRLDAVRGDVRDADLVRRVVGQPGVRLVLHFAAQTAVTTSLGDPREDLDVN